MHVVDSNQQFLNQLEEMGGGKASPEPTYEEGRIQYTSHPIKKYRVGRFEFEDALLTLRNAEDEAEFLKIIDDPKFPERERHMIRKLDVSAAERISREYRKASGGATKQFDSTVGERGEKAKVGVGDLLESHKKREELGIEAAAEGGREMNIPGAPDSNRETQTEPSPQSPPETPFRAEAQGAGGRASAEQLREEVGASEAEVAPEIPGKPVKPDTEDEPPAVESPSPKPGDDRATPPRGPSALAGLPKSEKKD